MRAELTAAVERVAGTGEGVPRARPRLGPGDRRDDGPDLRVVPRDPSHGVDLDDDERLAAVARQFLVPMLEPPALT
ncbi:hypothetical protein [Actinophytocola gossypii]|uniref:hypothetical protein n=1 Tax=Actinophytocola gossypii TaxID=2812003 RepID=UPI0028832FC0|nr:hypothetical protein [Actinophytocola gossypii]